MTEAELKAREALHGFSYHGGTPCEMVRWPSELCDPDAWHVAKRLPSQSEKTDTPD